MILYFNKGCLQIPLQNITYLLHTFNANQNLSLHVASQNYYANIQYTTYFNILICLLFQQSSSVINYIFYMSHSQE
jgi:hypothetical protein